MAIMRTNRLTSKTTPPKTVTTKNVTVSNVKPRKMVPASDLEAQDAAYKKYQQDTEVYNKKMGKYNELTKDNPTRDYMPVFGGEKNTRRLNAAETAEWNKKRSAEFGDEYIEEKDINVPTGNYKKLTDGGKTYSGDVSVHMSSYVKPTAPEKKDKADWSNVQLDKMATKKPSITASKGKLKGVTERAEPAQFTDPGRANKEKVKTSRALTGGGDKLVKAKNPRVSTAGAPRSTTAQLGAPRVISTEKKVQLGYNREQKLHKAYAGTSVLGESHIGKTSTDIKSYKNDMKSQRKEYRKEGNAEGVAATTMEIRQSRQAERFAARGEKGKNVHFTDKNYQKTTGNTGRISNDYKKSADNAANRNSMQNKLNAISTRSKNNTSLY
jgi:hypothetical protein